MMTWFESLTGFSEQSPQHVRENLSIEGNVLTSRINGASMACGELETPTLGELRQRVENTACRTGGISLREVVADVQDLHADESNSGSLFQVASQFNLLEMIWPNVTPEHGVGIYENDRTQGPACAIAAGAGTIYRNYFVPVRGRIGQSADNQIDCLAGVGEALGNEGNRLWEMKNGYALATEDGLIEISERLRSLSGAELDEFRQLLRIGVQWDTQVTLEGCTHLVSQSYCSALPVNYCSHPASRWQEFAQLVLEASYEAAICSAVLNRVEKGDNRVFLTLLGGGAFGNDIEWIAGAIRRAVVMYKHMDLDIALVSRGSPSQHVSALLEAIRAEI